FSFNGSELNLLRFLIKPVLFFVLFLLIFFITNLFDKTFSFQKRNYSTSIFVFCFFVFVNCFVIYNLKIMRYFTIQPSPSSDTSDIDSDEDAWCTTTDTSIHSDLGSFLEDMALHEGDLSNQYEHSDDFSDEENYDDFETDTETEEEDEEDNSEDLEEGEDSKSLDQYSIEESEKQDNETKTNESSYSTESELTDFSDEEMMELDDPVLKPGPQNNLNDNKEVGDTVLKSTGLQNTLYDNKGGDIVLKSTGLQNNLYSKKELNDVPDEATNTAVECCER
ncbi:hypothetical protein WDU94_013687, partial [Cyamophila willieti]